MFVFGPYTPMTVIEAATNLQASEDIKRTKIEERDDINLLLFMKHDHVQTVIALPRSVIDFTLKENTKSIKRDMAVFKGSSIGSPFALAN